MTNFMKMGSRLGSSYPLEKIHLKEGQGYRFAKAENGTLNRDLKDGVLVSRVSYDGDDWAAVDEPDLKASCNASYNDLSRHYGVWKDRSLFGLLPGNGRIEANEVKPLFNVFNSQHNLGWVGTSGTIGCHLFGFVDSADLAPCNGRMCLNVETPVSRKQYVNYSSADADICLDAYIRRDKQLDGG